MYFDTLNQYVHQVLIQPFCIFSVFADELKKVSALLRAEIYSASIFASSALISIAIISFGCSFLNIYFSFAVTAEKKMFKKLDSISCLTLPFFKSGFDSWKECFVNDEWLCQTGEFIRFFIRQGTNLLFFWIFSEKTLYLVCFFALYYRGVFLVFSIERKQRSKWKTKIFWESENKTSKHGRAVPQIFDLVTFSASLVRGKFPYAYT